MALLLIGITAVVSLPFLAFLAMAMIRKERNLRDDVRLSMQDGVRVLTTITDVHIGQDLEGGRAIGV